MTFWDDHARAEAERRLKPDGACNAPQRCECGHVGQDVFFGTCRRCFDLQEERA